jgi:hypothetical protein
MRSFRKSGTDRIAFYITGNGQKMRVTLNKKTLDKPPRGRAKLLA